MKSEYSINESIVHKYVVKMQFTAYQKFVIIYSVFFM